VLIYDRISVIADASEMLGPACSSGETCAGICRALSVLVPVKAAAHVSMWAAL